MCQHEKKICPKCNISFECKVGNISQCQCTAVVLSVEERNYIQSVYSDCLCANCLLAMKNKHHNASKDKHIAQARLNR
ncbi:cysteine-rich CWC family protein [Ferruginibacter sp. SUN002]|uniref:cysteine-rich CWC family protein n=1 Tax=Ferruginibacter sp. SUN002 TaxID=2937789 RepID=UPI003D361AA5